MSLTFPIVVPELHGTPSHRKRKVIARKMKERQLLLLMRGVDDDTVPAPLASTSRPVFTFLFRSFEFFILHGSLSFDFALFQVFIVVYWRSGTLDRVLDIMVARLTSPSRRNVLF